MLLFSSNVEIMTVIIEKGMSVAEIKKRLEKLKIKSKGFNAAKFLGKVKFEEDPPVIQKKLRDEWE